MTSFLESVKAKYRHEELARKLDRKKAKEAKDDYEERCQAYEARQAQGRQEVDGLKERLQDLGRKLQEMDALQKADPWEDQLGDMESVMAHGISEVADSNFRIELHQDVGSLFPRSIFNSDAEWDRCVGSRLESVGDRKNAGYRVIWRTGGNRRVMRVFDPVDTIQDVYRSPKFVDSLVKFFRKPFAE